MFLEHITLSQEAKEHLIKLKRTTGIMNWNVLCRWAFCTSLAEPTPPAAMRIPADSSVEMTWKTFGGTHAEVYEALLQIRCMKEGLELSDEVLAEQFRLHLHRGINYLFAAKEIREVENLYRRIPGLAS
ncbi:DNA sulfur modification protein DndE [Corallococcus sp. M7]